MAHDELQFVDWLRRQQRDHPAVELGIGDDMAVVRSSFDRILLSSDILLDGVHFDSRRQSPAEVGGKALACSLSDCAAMAVRPLAAVVSLALPKDMRLEEVEELYRGLWAMAAAHDVAVVGGDTTRWSHPLAIDVAITATPYPAVEPITRRGARPGDGLYVTGPLGGSLLGRHLSFTPRVAEARALATSLGQRLHAMIDISDGLSLDLWRLCDASEVGATLRERQLQEVVSADARRAADEDARSPLDHALSDGEDFELLLAVEGDPTTAGVVLFPVGFVTAAGLRIERLDGTMQPLEPKGYVH